MTFQEALLRRRIKFRTSGDRSKILLNCPFCSSRGKPADDKFRLCVHATQGWGRCVHCDWKRKTAVFAVLKELGINDSVNGFDEKPIQKDEPVFLPVDFQLLHRAYDDLDRQAKKYLIDRGVTEEQIIEKKIGVSYSGRFAYRIIFPVYNGSKLVGLNGRDFTGAGKPKYLTSKGEKSFYGFDSKAHTLVLSEGCFKALRIAQVTKACSAALLGHDLTNLQLEQLKASKCERIVLYPDIDEVGKKGFAKIADRLMEEFSATVSICWPVTLPADDAPLKEIKTLIENPLPYNWGTRQKLLTKYL